MLWVSGNTHNSNTHIKIECKDKFKADNEIEIFVQFKIQVSVKFV
jgi:hypothetical protein